ncbi:hypothetical protein NM688_g7843 [Phlebia brevispora]|uniref:Uncharacterized protein n=1 Tax=Phlebia brevispora TaxID=194682 RepID=A0ACC1S0K1_9APHY|nr:hypothetical protein NM688_g7843 [Phlebia brevispora]
MRVGSCSDGLIAVEASFPNEDINRMYQPEDLTQPAYDGQTAESIAAKVVEEQLLVVHGARWETPVRANNATRTSIGEPLSLNDVFCESFASSFPICSKLPIDAVLASYELFKTELGNLDAGYPYVEPTLSEETEAIFDAIQCGTNYTMEKRFEDATLRPQALLEYGADHFQLHRDAPYEHFYPGCTSIHPPATALAQPSPCCRS